jgi:hypothetical protein
LAAFSTDRGAAESCPIEPGVASGAASSAARSDLKRDCTAEAGQVAGLRITSAATARAAKVDVRGLSPPPRRRRSSRSCWCSTNPTASSRMCRR